MVGGYARRGGGGGMRSWLVCAEVVGIWWAGHHVLGSLFPHSCCRVVVGVCGWRVR